MEWWKLEIFGKEGRNKTPNKRASPTNIANTRIKLKQRYRLKRNNH